MNVKWLAVIFCTFVLIVEGFARKDKKKAQNTDEDLYGALVDEDDKSGVQNDDVYGDFEGEGIDTPEEHNDLNVDLEAKILSKPQKINATIGQIVTLPCQVTNKDPVMVWKHNNAILYQNGIALAGRPNVNNTENGSLVIRVLNSSDYGEYTCSILISETRNPEVVHTISESPLPAIISLTANKKELSVGDTLTLTCLANGDPTPTISWHKEERLGTTGETLIIDGIRPEDAGTYRCLADNKKGKPAHAVIEIFVKHAPKVSVEKYIVNSNHESDAELKCSVHGYPAPIINWQKNGANIAENPPKVKLTSHQRKNNMMEKILIIKDIKEEDFGTYSCSALNVMGSDSRNVSLVKTPAIREFHKPPKETKELTLSWKVESKSPPSGHELQYRKKGNPSWNSVKPEEIKKLDNDSYVLKHTLKGLEGGQYETRARSQNEHGWSEFSEIMEFEKAKHGHHHKHHTKKQHKKEEKKDYQTPAQQQDTEKRIPAEGASTTGSGTIVTSSIYLILSISILRLVLASKQ